MDDSHLGGRILVFAPAPLLTITIEPVDGEPEVHVHAGGQGVWQARMARTLGADVVVCTTFDGETGRVIRGLLADEDIRVDGVVRDARGAAYVHDRRSGDRDHIADVVADPLSRHDLDELYGLALQLGLDCDVVLLGGPHGDEVPADTYRRLAADLRGAGRIVMVDLTGERLRAALEGGIDIVKVSHEELLADGRIEQADDVSVLRAARQIRDAGARAVLVTRAGDPAVVVDGDEAYTVVGPWLEVVESAGAGDSFAAGVAAGLASGYALRDAVALGAAAGAANTARHGLGSGSREAVLRLVGEVALHGVRERGRPAPVDVTELPGLVEPGDEPPR